VADDREAVRYRFGPLERRGLVAGWRGGQIGAVAAGLLVAVVLMRGHPSPAGVAGALVVVTLAVAVATWPIAGRTAEEWAPDAVRHATRRPGRRRGAGPSPLADLQLLRLDDGTSEVAVVHDRARRRYTTVLRAWATGFVLSGVAEQEGKVAAWSAVLASLARQGGAVHRLQWVARCLPDDGTAVRRHWESASVLDGTSAAQRSYRALLDAEAGGARAHEVLLALTVDAARSARAVRAAGGGHTGACAVVAREAALLRRQLADAGVESGDLLDPAALAGALRRGFDAAAGAAAAHPSWPWPMAVEAEWGRLRADGTWHVTYWIAEWPRRPVGPDFLTPLLLADVRSSVSVVMEPVGALEAARRAERARTADIADAELRRRGGFLSSARRRREEETLGRREEELADGHSQYRFSGYVTVSAEAPDALEEACARTEQAAGRAGVELRRCYGDQGAAFACTLPLGRGLS
jgi:hypothetical protein